jgi:hypothetical protein
MICGDRKSAARKSARQVFENGVRMNNPPDIQERFV